MRDSVPYDIYVTENADGRYRHLPEHQTDSKAKESLDCMNHMQVGQQVIIICKPAVKKHSHWTGVAYDKFKRMKNNIYQKDRKACSTQREFTTSWHTVKSDSYAKKLRTNQHLVIERIK